MTNKNNEELDEALEDLDLEGTEFIKEEEKKGKGETGKEDFDDDDDDFEDNLKFTEVETMAVDRMNMLFVGNKDPNLHYRWVRDKEVPGRRAQGWTVDTKADALKARGDDINCTHELTLMNIPKHKAKAINEYWRRKANQMANRLNQDAGSKEYARKLLKSKGVPSSIIESVL